MAPTVFRISESLFLLAVVDTRVDAITQTLTLVFTPWLGYPVTRDTVISCTCITVRQILFHAILLFLIHVPPVHRYTKSLDIDTSYIGIIVTWLLGIQLYHVHSSLLHISTGIHACIVLIFLSYGSPSYYMYYCSLFSLYSCYMIVSCYWYWYSRYWIRELLICDVWN